MGVFFIDTARGTVATQRQLVEAHVMEPGDLPPRPWLRIQGTGDATTMWYAVMRKRSRGIFLGTLAMRHCPHHQQLLEQGWEEIPYDEVGPEGSSGAVS